MIALLFALSAASRDVAVPLAELPPPIRAAIEARWPGCTLTEAERERGTYDVQITTATGEHYEVEADARGTILEVEREEGADPEEDERDDDDDA